MHGVAWRGMWICVRSKDAQKQLARTSLKHKFTLEKQNKLNKAYTDRMKERNANEERFLKVWILNSFMKI